MKNLTLLLIVAFTLCAFQPVFAAFPVKRMLVTNAASTTVGETQKIAIQKSSSPSWLATKVASLLHPNIDYLYPVRRRSDAIGLTSFILGIVGLVVPLYGILLSIPAIILGAMGMHNDERFSVTGLVLGIVGVLYALLLIVLLILLAHSFSAGFFSYGIM